MYRIRLSVSVQDDIGYQVRDLSKELFTRIVTGERLMGDTISQDRWPEDRVYYTAVWRTDTHTWENALPAEQVDQAYTDWSQEQWA
mgnify:CR=1 FL=1